jgi:AmmeMemoRadiSam system protein A
MKIKVRVMDNKEKETEREERQESEIKDYREETKKILLSLARKAIERYLEKVEEGIIVPPHEIIEEKISEKVKREAKSEEEISISEEILKELDDEKGVFVTLRKNGEVRGCIGTLKEDKLWIQVQKYAVFSAFNDPRFPPLRKDELPQIKIEISVIENIEDVKDVSEIKLGEHGIILDMGGKGGILLPEVAIEHNVKTPEDFLDMLCKKIGVQKGSWKKGKIKKFKTKKISE